MARGVETALRLPNPEAAKTRVHMWAWEAWGGVVRGQLGSVHGCESGHAEPRGSLHL